LRNDTDGFPADPRGVVLEILPRALALKHTGSAGEEPEVIGTRHHFFDPDRLPWLAGVAVLRLDELVGIRLHGVGEVEEHTLALTGRRPFPRAERRLRRLERRVHVVGRRDR